MENFVARRSESYFRTHHQLLLEDRDGEKPSRSRDDGAFISNIMHSAVLPGGCPSWPAQDVWDAGKSH
jgi:hypothetical protein